MNYFFSGRESISFVFRPDYAKNLRVDDDDDDEEEEQKQRDKVQIKSSSGKLIRGKNRHRHDLVLVNVNEKQDRRIHRLQARQVEGPNDDERER